jgi:hypothetical protein
MLKNQHQGEQQGQRQTDREQEFRQHLQAVPLPEAYGAWP